MKATNKEATKSLSYNAVKNKSRRQAPQTRPTSEFVQLGQRDRKSLIATTQDQMRNVAMVPWMVRKHLDYVSRFKLQINQDNADIATLIKEIFDWHASPQNFDIAGRYGREEMFRMFELEKVTAGDAGINKLSDLKLQAVESDMIAKPTSRKMGRNGQTKPLPKEVSEKVTAEGVVLSPRYAGRVDKYCICTRGSTGKDVVYDHLERAENIIFDAYWSRFGSQIRGVSPLATAINTVQDLYENFEWHLLKTKIHAIFGVAIMRDYYGSETEDEETTALGQAVEGESSEDVLGDIETSMQDLNPDQMMLLDMGTKGKVDTIESKTPSAEFLDFSELMLRIAFMALDIPYTVFDSARSSFSALIADTNLYEVSCQYKRDKNRWARKNYSDWLIAELWANDTAGWDLRKKCESAGLSLKQVQSSVEWVSSGIPWLQKLQEVAGDANAIAIGADNIIDVCKRRGKDFYENVDKQAKAMDYAKEAGVSIMIGDPGQMSVEQIEKDEDADNE